MALKIATGGIHIESSTFTPYRSGAADFILRRGQAFLDWQGIGDFSGRVDWVPLVHGRAFPGGLVAADFYEAWESEFFTRLRDAVQHGLDAVYLDIHGAMVALSRADAERELAVRACVGPEVAVVASMDLRGNVFDRLFKNPELLSCYRTAPHVDIWETKVRVVRNLLELLEDRGRGQRWAKAKVDVPVLLPGEKTSTSAKPARNLYRPASSPRS